MHAIVVLFNRDLRVHDHPALAEAARNAEHVVPLFVLDDGILASDYAAPNRLGFLLESLRDLRSSLRDRGGNLVLRRGDPVEEALGLAAEVDAGAIYATADVSAHARRRERRLATACARARRGFVPFAGTTVVPADELLTSSGSHYKVFTPYWESWRSHSWRAVEDPPPEIRMPSGVKVGRLPALDDFVDGERSPGVVGGGETAGREQLERWERSSLADYDDHHDDLAADDTSRLSPYLHFGCVSALEIATEHRDSQGAQPFVRQLAWRDFHHQTTFAFPAITTQPFRDRGDRWSRDGDELEAWKAGRTGIPIVDAGMRQLLDEGWMHNRARLITASLLTKDLYIDWRVGAAHFWHWLVDGDIANNAANWQWVAGTGTDTRPNRVFNPIRQAQRFDPSGDYVRRYVPELADIQGADVHEPWELDADLDYPDPIVDHGEAAHRFLQRRGKR